MTRVLYLDDEHERVLELAARYLRTLHAVERAHALDDVVDDLGAIFSGIDPVDIQMVGKELELLRSMYRIAPIRITGEPRAARRVQADEPRPPEDSRGRSADSVSASSVPFPGHSVKVTDPRLRCV